MSHYSSSVYSTNSDGDLIDLNNVSLRHYTIPPPPRKPSDAPMMPESRSSILDRQISRVEAPGLVPQAPLSRLQNQVPESRDRRLATDQAAQFSPPAKAKRVDVRQESHETQIGPTAGVFPLALRTTTLRKNSPPALALQTSNIRPFRPTERPHIEQLNTSPRKQQLRLTPLAGNASRYGSSSRYEPRSNKPAEDLTTPISASSAPDYAALIAARKLSTTYTPPSSEYRDHQLARFAEKYPDTPLSPLLTKELPSRKAASPEISPGSPLQSLSGNQPQATPKTKKAPTDYADQRSPRPQPAAFKSKTSSQTTSRPSQDLHITTPAFSVSHSHGIKGTVREVRTSPELHTNHPLYSHDTTASVELEVRPSTPPPSVSPLDKYHESPELRPYKAIPKVSPLAQHNKSPDRPPSQPVPDISQLDHNKGHPAFRPSLQVDRTPIHTMHSTIPSPTTAPSSPEQLPILIPVSTMEVGAAGLRELSEIAAMAEKVTSLVEKDKTLGTKIGLAKEKIHRVPAYLKEVKVLSLRLWEITDQHSVQRHFGGIEGFRLRATVGQVRFPFRS